MKRVIIYDKLSLCSSVDIDIFVDDFVGNIETLCREELRTLFIFIDLILSPYFLKIFVLDIL